MLETETDLRSLFDVTATALSYRISGSATEFVGVKDSNYDDALDVNGRKTGLRVMSIDITNLTVDAVLIEGSTGDQFTVRAMQPGARTTLLVLEPI